MSINSWHLLHFHKLFLHMHSSTILGICNSNIRVIESNLLICPSLVTNWIWHESAYRKKSLTKTIAFIWWCLHNSSSAEVVVCRSGYSRPEFDCKKQFWRGFCSHSTQVYIGRIVFCSRLRAVSNRDLKLCLPLQPFNTVDATLGSAGF